MRLHHLEVTAFGPFATTARVDLDELAEAGLFLLSGPTGAGKTSVLDAVCFALYGDVPGDRSQARRLRCDRSAPDLAPRVVLEATLAGRRLRLERSPAWERPKRRGTGTTRQQASVTVSERVDGAWRPLTSRLDEAGHLVGELLGMTLTQFTQVALLPQGRFQAFLRARADERQQLLARLFRTGRFEDVERWLRDRRAEVRRRSAGHQQELADLVSRVSETTAEPVPSWAPEDADPSPGPAGPDLAVPAADGRVLAWVAGLDARAAELAGDCTEELRAATRAEEDARSHVAETRALLDRLERWRAAARERRALDAAEDDHVARCDELDRARRAAPVLTAHRQVVAAADRAEAAALSSAEATAAVAADLDLLVVDRSSVERAVAGAEEAVAGLRSARPAGERLDRLDRRDEAVRRRRTELADDLERVRAEHTAAPARTAALAERCRDADDAAAALPQATARATALEALLDDLAAERELVGRLADARETLHLARGATLEIHEALLAVREARVAGMAAEIASALAVGACCPVCGSEEHPRKATPASGAPDATSEREAQRRLDDARLAEHAHDGLVRDLVVRLDLVRERVRGSLGALAGAGSEPVDPGAAPESGAGTEAGVGAGVGAGADAGAPLPAALDHAVRDALGSARRHREELRARAGEAPRLAAALAGARADELGLASRLATVERDLLAAGESLDELATEREATLAELRGVLAAAGEHVRDAAAGADDDAPEVDGAGLGALIERLTEHHAGIRDRARRALRLLDEAAAAEEALGAARAALAAEVHDSGFASADEAVAAGRDRARVDDLERAVTEHRRRRAAVEAVLADPAVVAAARTCGVAGLDGVEQAEDTGAPPRLPDLAAAESAHAAARERLGSAESAAATARARAQRLACLREQVAAALDRWAPVREELATTAALASFVEGRSADNRLQMRLSAYVLAHRLAQVVAAANERLARMTGSRYALEHTGRRGAGETRGGLGLLVRDDWSGESRDPATLSGGETFVVSLALALGLADVIAHEAGGAELDTLFVDEGFGSLDAETLDDVMDVLDGLRDGGRVVGVVSHVAEMRERIPTRLEVTKGRAGSGLRTVHG